MYYDELVDTIEHMTQDGKGILAADESNATIAKRFADVGVENSEDNRRDYRLLLANTAQLEEYIHSVILFEETFQQQDGDGTPIAEVFAQKGIIPGIKVDKGLVNLANTEEEKITQGLDGLHERLLHFKQLGAKFAKWRNVYSITEFTPSLTAMHANAEVLARYAAACQAVGIVPIVEPEILMTGHHNIIRAAEATEMVLHELFHALYIHQVDLELIILKPSMVTCGQDVQPGSTPEEVAEMTLSVFRSNVPAAVPSINFLSGGQTPEQATLNLNAINASGYQPWTLSFSYGRALQEECLQAWRGNHAHVEAAQQVLLSRARGNSLACFGEYPAATA